jgi:hypothetical protein
MDDQATKQRRCATCQQAAPSTETVHTLISGRYGWRCVRLAVKADRYDLVWYCPGCWKKYKSSRAPSAT